MKSAVSTSQLTTDLELICQSKAFGSTHHDVSHSNKRKLHEEVLDCTNGTKRKKKRKFNVKTKKKCKSRKRKTSGKHKKKRPQYNDDVNSANHQHLTIIRKAPTLQTISGDILDNDKKVFDHYHLYLRDDVGSNWADSIEVGDVVEFNYSSTYKLRFHQSHTKENRLHTVYDYDMPKWIPIQIKCKAYSVTIQYILDYELQRPLQETIRIGDHSHNHDIHSRIRPIQSSQSVNYLKEGHLIEIYDDTTLKWVRASIVSISTYFEFVYKSALNELIYDSCFMDEVNIRLPLQCIPYCGFTVITENDIGRIVRVYWSHSGGEWYEGIIQSIDINNKILVLFYRDKYMEELRWNYSSTLFYFPITKLEDIISWIYYRPNCCFCGCLMQERMATKCKYQHNVCWKCDNKFVQKDSIWICPFEKRVKYHPRKYYIDSNCVNQSNHSIHSKSVNIKYRNTNLVFGHRNSVTNMAELYRIHCTKPLPHIQLINNDDDKPIIIDKEIIQRNKYLEEYIHKLYHSVLYQPFNENEYFVLSKRYLHSNWVPLKRNRKSPLNDSDIITAAKYSFSTKLQNTINIFLKNNNKHSLFYILKAMELRYFYISNAWNGRPYSRGLSDDLAMQYQWIINMKHNLIPPILNSANNSIIHEIAQNNNIDTRQAHFIKYTQDPILSGSIAANVNTNDNDNDDDDDDESNDDTNRIIHSGRMGAFCVPQFDICIFVRYNSDDAQSKKSNKGSVSYELYKTAEAIVLTREDTHLSHRGHQWREDRERLGNPWIRGDECMIYVDQSAIWLEAKIVKIYSTECKVDIYSNQLRWPKHRTYGGLSQYIMPKIKRGDTEDIALIDKLNNGTPIKLWGPPWREGRVLWKWNEDDLVCIQLNGQRLQYAQTYHVMDPKWKISIIKDKAHDIVDIEPPLQFIMAKSKYNALSNHVINSGLLMLSDYCESDQDIIENHEDDDNQPDDNHIIEILDITQSKRQKLNKVKIMKLKKRKLIKKKRKKKEIKKKKECREGIGVYGIDEGAILYPNDNVDIQWTLNDHNYNDDSPIEWNIYLEIKKYELILNDVELTIDRVLLGEHIILPANTNGQYSWNAQIAIHIDAICYIRIVLINNGFISLTGTSNIFEVNTMNKCIEFEDDTTLNANQEIHKNDNGAFCICGSVQNNIDDICQDDIDDNIEWIQCDVCYCWQHIGCLNVLIDSNSVYKCVWCNDEYEQYFDCLTEKMLKFIQNLFSASIYRGKRYGKYYNKKKENIRNIEYLRDLCIVHGVDSNSNDVDILQSNLTYCSRFARTPLTLANFMCSLFGINDEKDKDVSLNCVDLMAGNGNLCRFIASHHNILAVEKNESRLAAGKHLVSNAVWLKMDVFSAQFITKYVINKVWDIVYCNPDLKNIIPSIYIGLEMIKKSDYKNKCLIYLLPIDVFESNSYQSRLFCLLDFHIDTMYQIGRWNYYDNDKSHPKSICDAVWIMKPKRKTFKYTFRCYDVRSNRKLTAKSLETTN